MARLRAAVVVATVEFVLPVVLLRLVLILGVGAVALWVDPAHAAVAVALGVATALLVSGLDRRALLRASAALMPAGAVRGRGLAELTRRGAFRRLQRPDVPGKPRARAPGRA